MMTMRRRDTQTAHCGSVGPIRLGSQGGCCSPANSDSIHYQFIYSLPEQLRDIHQTRAPYVTMGRSNDLPRPEPRAKSPEKAMTEHSINLSDHEKDELRYGPLTAPGLRVAR